VVSVDSDTTSGYFSKWVHTCSYCVDADSPTHSCRHSELCFGWLFNEDQCQSIYHCCCSITHTKNNINSIHFNDNIKIKSNYNFKWHRHKQLALSNSFLTLLSEACVPFFKGSCGHSCNWRTHLSCSPGTPVIGLCSGSSVSCDRNRQANRSLHLISSDQNRFIL